MDMVEFYYVGIKSNLFSTLVDYDTSCEICAAIIQLSLNQQLVVINVYRPPNRDLEYQQELCNCICEIVRRYPNSFIFVLGILISQTLTGLVTQLLIINILLILAGLF